MSMAEPTTGPDAEDGLSAGATPTAAGVGGAQPQPQPFPTDAEVRSGILRFLSRFAKHYDLKDAAALREAAETLLPRLVEAHLRQDPGCVERAVHNPILVLSLTESAQNASGTPQSSRRKSRIDRRSSGVELAGGGGGGGGARRPFGEDSQAKQAIRRKSLALSGWRSAVASTGNSPGASNRKSGSRSVNPVLRSPSEEDEPGSGGTELRALSHPDGQSRRGENVMFGASRSALLAEQLLSHLTTAKGVLPDSGSLPPGDEEKSSTNLGSEADGGSTMQSDDCVEEGYKPSASVLRRFAFEGNLEFISLRHQRLRLANVGTEEQFRNDRLARWTSRWKDVYANASLLVILFNLITVTLHMGLGAEAAQIPYGFVLFEALVDVVMFICTVGGGLLEPYEEKGMMVSELRRTAKHYLSSPERFVFDLLSCAPLLVFALGTNNPTLHDYLRVNVLLRTWRFHEHFDSLKAQFDQSVHPSVWRLLIYVCHFLMIVTVMSTVALMAVRFQPEEGFRWFESGGFPLPRDNPSLLYSQVWRMSLENVAHQSIAYPITDLQTAIGLLLVTCALLVIWLLLATFEEIIVEMIEASSILASKIEAVSIALAHMGVPDSMIDEVATYYSRMWSICHTFDLNGGAEILEDLPDVLRNDIEYEGNYNILLSIPLFAAAAKNEVFVRHFAGEMSNVVVLPGAPMVSRGEKGDCLFFLSQGDAAVLGKGGETLRVIQRGAYFGEVSMLFGGRQPNTIVAITLCTCFVVTDEQFSALIDDYPEALEAILQSALQQMKANRQRVRQARLQLQGVADCNVGAVPNPLKGGVSALDLAALQEAEAAQEEKIDLANLRNAFRKKSVAIPLMQVQAPDEDDDGTADDAESTPSSRETLVRLATEVVNADADHFGTRAKARGWKNFDGRESAASVGTDATHGLGPGPSLAQQLRAEMKVAAEGRRLHRSSRDESPGTGTEH